MKSYLIKDTTREERERIVSESVGQIEAAIDPEGIEEDQQHREGDDDQQNADGKREQQLRHAETR